MKQAYAKPALLLSYVISGVAAIASLGGFLLEGLYRDNAFVASTWAGNDAVTLVVAVPCLLAAARMAVRGSLRAQLIWIGMLDYMLYNFAFYLFGTAFNWFFPLYVALFGMSIWALALAFASVDVERIGQSVGPRVPVKVIAGYMLIVGLGLATVYLADWLRFALSGKVPTIVTQADHPTNIIFALDLSLVIPVFVVGALLLLRRRPWGYVLSAMVNVKGVVYMTALCAATVTAFQAGTVKDVSQLAIWGAIGVGSAVAVTLQLRGSRPE